MKQIIFNENDINDLSEVAEKLFVNTDANDPSSIYYKRHLERPEIHWIHIGLHVIVPIIISILLFSLLHRTGTGIAFSLIIIFSAWVLYILVSLKNILICVVRLYQHFAPDSIRMKCRFEPSCSQYMILAIQKYGAFRGLRLGIKRLGRCKIGNGGYDFP